MKQAELHITGIAGELVLFSPLIFMVVSFVSFTGKRGSTARFSLFLLFITLNPSNHRPLEIYCWLLKFLGLYEVGI